MEVINPPQFGGVKLLVESEGADFIASATSGKAPGFTSKAENGALNWDANNVATSSLPLSIPAVSCEFGGFCPGKPQTLEQSLLQIPTALGVTAIAIERKFAQDGTVTETEVARLLVKTYDIEKPAPLTLGAITGQSLNTRQKVFVTVPGARFDEAEGITVRLLRSNDINLSRFADFFPGGDFTCPEQPFRNTFQMCGLEVVDAQKLSFSIDAFLDEDRAKERNILGSYDIYVRWSPENPVAEIFRTLESVGLGVWTIGEGPEGADYSVRHIEVNQAVQTDDNRMPMVRDKRTVVRVYPQDENLLPTKFSGPPVAVNLRGQTGQDGPLLGVFTRFPGGTAGPDARMKFLRKHRGFSANFILPREWTQVEDLLLTATVNLDESGGPLSEESSTDNNTKSESFRFTPRRKALAIGYLEACPDGCDNGVHNADRFLRKVFPAAETSGVAYIPLGVPEGLFGDPISGFTLAGLLNGFKAVLFVQRDIVDMVAVGARPIAFPDEEEHAREILLRQPLKRVGGIFVVLDGPREKSEIELPLAIVEELSFNRESDNRCSATSRAFPTAVGLDTQGIVVKELLDFTDLYECRTTRSNIRHWISPVTYAQLFEFLDLLAARAEPLREKQQAAPGEFFLISGTVRSGGGGVLDPAYRVPASKLLAPGAQSGDLCVELSGGGGTLGRSCFDADFSGGSEQPFILSLPHHADGRCIALMQGGAELASLIASASPPDLAITSPGAGASLDASAPLTIAWTASDADGDSLTFTALYSPDGGESWLPLGVDIVESSVTFNPAQIEGGENVLFRVLASDGFHTTEQTIGPLNVVQRPAIAVDAPADLGAAPARQLSEGVVEVRSSGTGPLVIESATIDNPAFRVLSRMPMQVRAGATRNLEVEFTPGMTGKETGTLTLTTNAADQPTFDVLVEATGLDPEQAIFFVSIESETLDFGETPIGQAADVPIAIINRGQAGMSVEATLEGDGFRFEQTTAALTDERPGQATLTVSGGQQLNLTVIFEPPSQQEFNGRLVLASDDQNQSRVEIALEGRGVEPPTIPAISPGGIVDAAQFQPTVSQGGISSIFGSELADDIVIAGDVPLPFELGGARVLVDGWEAPLFFVSPNQINFQVPFEAGSPRQCRCGRHA